MENNVEDPVPSTSTQNMSQPTPVYMSTKRAFRLLAQEALAQKQPMHRFDQENGDIVYRIGNIVVTETEDCSRCKICQFRATNKQIRKRECKRQMKKAKIEQQAQGGNKPMTVIPVGTKVVMLNITVDDLKEDTALVTPTGNIKLLKENVIKSSSGKDQIWPGDMYPVFQFRSRGSAGTSRRHKKKADKASKEKSTERPSVIQYSQAPVPTSQGGQQVVSRPTQTYQQESNTLGTEPQSLDPQGQIPGTGEQGKKKKKKGSHSHRDSKAEGKEKTSTPSNTTGEIKKKKKKKKDKKKRAEKKRELEKRMKRKQREIDSEMRDVKVKTEAEVKMEEDLEVHAEAPLVVPTVGVKFELRIGNILWGCGILDMANDEDPLVQASSNNEGNVSQNSPSSLAETEASEELKLSRLARRAEQSGKTIQQMFGDLTRAEFLDLSDADILEMDIPANDDRSPFHGHKNDTNQAESVTKSTKRTSVDRGQESSAFDIIDLTEDEEPPNPKKTQATATPGATAQKRKSSSEDTPGTSTSNTGATSTFNEFLVPKLPPQRPGQVVNPNPPKRSKGNNGTASSNSGQKPPLKVTLEKVGPDGEFRSRVSGKHNGQEKKK